MYKNVGRKIKTLASVLTWIGIVASVIAAIVCFVAASKTTYGSGMYIAYGIAVLVIGCLASWLSNLVLYGFGELVDNSSIIARESQSHKDYAE